MKAKVNHYRREGRLALRHMWFVIVVFAVVQVIVSIAVAAANAKTSLGGLKSAGFAAIWSMFLVIIFTVLGGKMVLTSNKSSELMVGFMIGIAAMLTELFFVLMVMFFILGQEASSEIAPSDKAYAVFSLLNMIIYFVWTIILVVHRRTVAISSQEAAAATSKEYGQYGVGVTETYNPAIGPVGGAHEEFTGDQEEL
mmetsp:Transcript_29907/g.41088  ORF Transcript_29907/g.41088 Transcript_29907/m.41088 type:complete len:197 (+) Transcript_29907:64-654(+)|eukprot:CAMPEP_0170078416 /NCGR_PEP_ID=MMETSP0019_2-20121128/15009_1 /TAXON_ID=98059 /ORGANISM="Dinobryon sp., Strain UTEXLB2267" /LENGTH=196 /DNA_ID=CAMNT_0010291275 /DNA_START=72 /DNA_END=662 /DNA_ORIENTATION=+